MPRVGGVTFSIRVTTGNSQQAITRVVDALKNAGIQFTKTETKAQTATKAFGSMADALVALGAAAGASNLLSFAKDATILAARAENLRTVIDNLGRTANKTSAEITVIEERTQALGITVRQSRQAIALLAQSELDLANASRLARIAQDAAVIAGINSSDAFERLTIAIQRNDSRLLRNLGIVVNLNEVYQRYSLTTGHAANTLTPLQKRQLLLNEVMQKGKVIAGTYEAALGDVFKRFTSMDRLVEEARREFGEQFIPVMEIAVDTTSRFLKNFAQSDTLKSFTAGVTGAAVALGGLVAALGALKLAAFAITALNPPLLALAGAATVLGARFAILEAEAGRARAAIKDLRMEAEKTVQVTKDTKELGEQISELASNSARSAAEQSKLLNLVDQLQTYDEGLGRTLKRYIDTQRDDLVVRELRIRSLDKEIDVNKELQVNQELLTQKTAASREAFAQLLSGNLSQAKEFFGEIPELEKVFDFRGDLTDRMELARQAFDQLVAREPDLRSFSEAAERAAASGRPLIDVFSVQIPFSEVVNGLSITSKAVTNLVTEIETLNLIKLKGASEEFEKFAKTVEDAALLSDRNLDKLATARKKIYSGTALEFEQEYEQRANDIRNIEFQTREEIEAGVKAQTEFKIAQEKRNTENSIQELRKRLEAEGATQLEITTQVDALIEQQKDKVRSLKQAEQDRINAIIANQDKVRQNAETNNALLDLELKTIRDQTKALKEKNDALERGDNTDIANLRKALEEARTRFELRLTGAGGKGFTIAKFLFGQIPLTRSAFSGLLAEYELYKETTRGIEQQIEKIYEDERKKAQDELDRIDERRKRSSERFEDFLNKFRFAETEKKRPGFTAIKEAFEEFEAAVDNATTVEQLEELRKQFTKTMRELRKSADTDLKAAEKAYEDFLNGGRRDKEREFGRQLRERQDELRAAGVNEAQIAEESARLREENDQALYDEEEKLRQEAEKRRRGKGFLGGTRKDAEEELGSVIQARIAELQKEAEARAKLEEQAQRGLETAQETLAAQQGITNELATQNTIAVGGPAISADEFRQRVVAAGGAVPQDQNERIANILQQLVNQRAITVEEAARFAGDAQQQDRRNQTSDEYRQRVDEQAQRAADYEDLLGRSIETNDELYRMATDARKATSGLRHSR